MFSNKKNLEILKEAFDAIAKEEALLLPTFEESSHVRFSKEFEEKMQRLIQRQSRPYYYLVNTVGKRVACILLIFLITLTSITFGVKAIREAVIEFFVKTFDRFSIITLIDNKEKTIPDFIETYCYPTYIPNGFELKFEENLATYHRLQYISENGYIYFNQNTLQGLSTYVDTENAEAEKILISGYDGLYVLKDNIVLIYWNDSSYSFMIRSESNLTKEEIIKFAESVRFIS